MRPPCSIWAVLLVSLRRQVKNALLILLQQNIVRCTAHFAPPRGASGPSYQRAPQNYQYDAYLNEILVRRWFPDVAPRPGAVSSDEERLLQELLTCGQLSTNMMIERAVNHFAAERRLAADDPLIAERQMALMSALQQLRVGRYIVPTDFLLDGVVEEPAGGAMRRQMPNEAAIAAAIAAATKSSGGGGAGRKRTHDGNAVADGGQDDEAELLWRPHVARFQSDFKHLAMRRLVGDKLDSNAEGLLEIMLGQQRSTPGAVEDGLAAAAMFREPFTADQLLHQCPVRFSDDGPHITRPLVLNYLDAMCSDPMIKMATTLNGKYMLELGEIANAVKQTFIEGIVRHKTGESGCRLYRILTRMHAHGGCASRGQQKYELKQLAEQALLPEKDARPLLWALLQAGYVLLQEVPRSNDRNPKTTTYLWHVSLTHAYRTFEEELLETIRRLQRRVDAERAAGAGDNAHATAGDEQVREAALARARIDGLDGAIMRLFDTLLLLRAL